jgi:hypothetical protein
MGCPLLEMVAMPVDVRLVVYDLAFLNFHRLLV